MDDYTIVAAILLGVVATAVGGIGLWIRWVSSRLIELGKAVVKLEERNNFDFSRLDKMEKQVECIPEMKRTLGRIEGMVSSITKNGGK